MVQILVGVVSVYAAKDRLLFAFALGTVWRGVYLLNAKEAQTVSAPHP